MSFRGFRGGGGGGGRGRGGGFTGGRGRGGGGRGRDNRSDGGGFRFSSRKRIGKTIVPKDIEVGIECFLNESEGFKGRIKKRHSDFIVSEINLDNEMAQLTKLASYTVTEAEVEQEAKRQKLNDGSSLAISGNSESNYDAGYEALVKAHSNEAADSVRTFMTGEDEYGYLPPSTDKTVRTSFHNIIKLYFENILISDTIDDPKGSGGKCVRIYKKGKKRGRDDGDSSSIPRDVRGNKSVWPKDRPPYLKFILHKFNKDTMSAVRDLSFFIKKSEKFLSYAGTKDKRAFTSQFMTAKYLSMEAMKSVSRRLEDKGLFVGNMEYVLDELHLGDLNGNQFTITVRNVEGKEETILNAVENIKLSGFINYFGLQRFGTTSVPSHFIGRQLLKQDWKEAVELILRPKAGDYEDSRAAKKLYFEKNDIKGAFDLMPHSDSAEKSVLAGLVKNGANAYLNAIQNINKQMRSMYIHAYQSYLWNKAASKRVTLYGKDFAREGDVILIPGTEIGKKTRREWFAHREEEGEEEKKEEEGGEEKTEGEGDETEGVISIEGEYKLVSAVEEKSRTFSIFDVVIPVPGFDVLMPTNDIGKYFDMLLKEDGLDSSIWSAGKQKEFRLPGGYRRLIQRGERVSVRIFKYNDIFIPLSLTDMDHIDGKPPPQSIKDGKLTAAVVSFGLNSSTYATMFLRELMKRPSNESEENTDVDDDKEKGEKVKEEDGKVKDEEEIE